MSKLINYIASPYIGAAMLGIGLFFAYQSITRQAVVTEAFDNNNAAAYRECVFETIRAQEAAKQADFDKFMRETEGLPVRAFREAWRMLPPSPSAAEVLMAQRANLTRIKELCRLRFPCAPLEILCLAGFDD